MQIGLLNKVQNHILTTKTYPEFKQLLEKSNCLLCELSKSRTNIVVDRGNPEAKVVMIGEAPGENEDLQKRAFVGRSGKLLDDMMSQIGFDTNRDSLIVNVVKCRPPENRAPKPCEISACRVYFDKQFSLISPKIILLLGATALKHVIPGRKDFLMAAEAGNFFEDPAFPGAKLMPLYHPAYLLRDPRKKTLMTDHLKRFKAYWTAIR